MPQIKLKLCELFWVFSSFLSAFVFCQNDNLINEAKIVATLSLSWYPRLFIGIYRQVFIQDVIFYRWDLTIITDEQDIQATVRQFIVKCLLHSHVEKVVLLLTHEENFV